MDRAKKIVVTPDEQAPAEIDRLERLARECAKLDKAEEQALAEEDLASFAKVCMAPME